MLEDQESDHELVQVDAALAELEDEFTHLSFDEATDRYWQRVNRYFQAVVESKSELIGATWYLRDRRGNLLGMVTGYGTVGLAEMHDEPLTYEEAVQRYWQVSTENAQQTPGVVLDPDTPNRGRSELIGSTWHLQNVRGPLATVAADGKVRLAKGGVE